MPEQLIIRQEYCAKLDSERWLVLSGDGSHHWHFGLLGPEPLDLDIEDVTVPEAKEYAANVAVNYLRVKIPGMTLPEPLPWRTAVVAIRRAA